MESTGNIIHGWETLHVALNKHGHFKEPLSSFQKKMPEVKVAENGSGLSLGRFPGIEVKRLKEPLTNPQRQAAFVLAPMRLCWLPVGSFDILQTASN